MDLMLYNITMLALLLPVFYPSKMEEMWTYFDIVGTVYILDFFSGTDPTPVS